ncbi:uncharacterized protein LY89DRAFT_240890 [Mollisia scopiformis]|uniref:Uncharacterized protein n=1 Tax=Mollisia scopiformis TaxID=149040 RepID=A0A194WUH8_MOLSC|nr:uncharacterized protein LY89DRAFT_240890 [Mollisia scopiformis]KUJ11267.1 hypothetical protein LY89DRAFT_240890 [Mollisia scopiformis]
MASLWGIAKRGAAITNMHSTTSQPTSTIWASFYPDYASSSRFVLYSSTMSSEPLNFEPIKDDERSVLSSDAQHDILNLFEAAINSSLHPNIDEKAERFVKDLVTFASEGNSGLDADSVASATWKVLINAASCIPCRHCGQDVLVKIVGLLDTAGDTWKDYPGFGITMRENWNRSPVFQIDDDDDGGAFTLDEWLNLNSFLARLGEDFISFGLWELRNGMEGRSAEEMFTPKAVANARILVAAEWIIRGGRGLLRESLLNALSHEPTSGKPWAGGPLFPGARGFNLERWRFWKRR